MDVGPSIEAGDRPPSTRGLLELPELSRPA